MTQIATYVYLDLETTGLPFMEHNKTRITELSMLVVKREHLLERALLPFQPKLTMYFNPWRTIEPEATRCSGLDNYLLEHESKFDMNAFNTINSFLECQQKPICLIAENGYKFDFPILKNHFENLDVTLADDIMCADSLNAFYDIMNMKLLNRDIACQSDETDKVAVSYTDKEAYLSKVKTEAEDGMSLDPDSHIFFQKQNEMTPKQLTKPKNCKSIKAVRRKIFYEKDKKPVESYKLKDINERVLGQPAIDAHRAEKDCMMTAEISVAKAEQFVLWIDANHCPFSEVPAMRPGAKAGY